MLSKNRVDIIPMSNLGFFGFCRSRTDCNEYESLLQIPELSHSLYFAYSQNTDDVIVKKTIDALSGLKNSGRYHELLKEWYIMSQND